MNFTKTILNGVKSWISSNFISYRIQTLTDAQKEQARANIGALDATELPNAINQALAQAKESGEFDGAKGDDGYSPERGVDYWTDEDKAEIKAYVNEAILEGAW